MSQVLPSASLSQAVQAGSQTPSNLARVKAGIDPWTVDDAADLYNLRGWGKGFFEISKSGHVLVRPTRTPGREVNLFEVVKGLRERGVRVFAVHPGVIMTRLSRHMQQEDFESLSTKTPSGEELVFKSLEQGAATTVWAATAAAATEFME